MYILKPLVFLMLIAFPVEEIVKEEQHVQQLPSANWMRTRKIDVKHIALDLRFDWNKKQVYGTATITLSSFNPANTIALDAGLLSIHSVMLLHGAALKFNYDGGDKNDGLEITLDRLYKAGEELTVQIDYNSNWVNHADPNNIWGSFGKGLRFFEPTSTAPGKRKQVWSSGEPESNRYWFPGYDAPNDVRTTELTATVDKGLTVISNGNLVHTKDNADGTRSFYYKADDPYPNYLTSLVAGDYVDVKQDLDGIALHSFGYPDEKDAIEATVVRLPGMVEYFTSLTGVKYPYKQYTQVMVQDYPFPGLNGQHTATTISDNMIDDYRTHADFFYLWDGVEAHALASQWFGNLLTPRSWEHIWLSESFCHYLDGSYNDHKNGHDEFLLYYINPDQAAVSADWASGIKHPVVTPYFNDAATFTAGNYVKTRGALVLRMLRKHLGEDRFFKAIKNYTQSNAGRQVTTEDFQRAVEETTGESLGWFFEQWVYKMGQPGFEIVKTYDKEKKQLLLQVKQVQKKDSAGQYPQVDFFQGKVEIEIDGMIKEIWLDAKSVNELTFSLAQEPLLVNFDYEKTWIKDIQFVKPLDELLYQLQNDKDILGRQWSVDELVKAAKSENISSGDKERIYAAFRTVIESNAYWRFRSYTMFQLRSLMGTPDEATLTMLLSIIKKDKPWVRTGAITFLGMSKDPKYTGIYLNALDDESDRVINAAAIALGKTKSPGAFDALVKLKDKPSWKSQSLISALNGLKELGDPRGAGVALEALANVKLPRWWLATPIWDYPVAAAQTLVTLGKREAAYKMIFERFKQSLTGNDYNDIFSNTLLIATLADPRGSQVFDLLKAKFKDDANAMIAVNTYETQFNEAVKKN